MRIISPFTDYYDCISNIYGFNYQNSYQDLLYIREEEIEISTIKIKSPFNAFHRKYHNSIEGYVVFCNQVYPFYFNKGVKYYGVDKDFIEFLLNTPEYKNRNVFYFESRYKTFEKRLTDSIKQISEIAQKLLQEHESPYLVITNNGNEYLRIHEFSLIKNKRLSDISFYRVKPPMECWTDIRNYLSTHLVKEHSPPVEISDKDKLQAKGFDQFSFKKQKTKKRFR